MLIRAFFALILTTSVAVESAQFSRSCRNLLRTDCLQTRHDLASAFDNLCECDLHPVKAASSGNQLILQITSPAYYTSSLQTSTPAIKCMRFSRVLTDSLLSCLAQPQTIRSLDFYMENWSKGLPSFVNLTSLRVLRLRQLGLSDIDAKAFAGLNHLKVLELSDNKFKTLPHGLLDNLAGLDELILHGNRLVKLERNQFAAGATKLKRLTLSEMEFATIPQGFFDIFPQLEFLAIRRTFVNHLSHVGTLRHLRSLHLDQNRIKTLEPNAFSGLYNLRTLDLRRNRLRTFEAQELLVNQLSSLEELWLGDNVFTCDCSMAPLASWLRQRLQKLDRNSSSFLSFDPSNELCHLKGDLMMSPTTAKLSCGPRCDMNVPSEYFVDVPENQLICTTTTTTTRSTTSTLRKIVTKKARPVSWFVPAPGEDPLDDDEVVLTGSQLMFLSETSNSNQNQQQPKNWDRFTLILWLAVAAVVSLLIVVGVTILVRHRNSRSRNRKFNPQNRHHSSSSSSMMKNAPLASLDRGCSATTMSPDHDVASSTSTSTSGHAESDASHQTESSHEFANVSDKKPIDNDKIAACCYPKRSQRVASTITSSAAKTPSSGDEECNGPLTMDSRDDSGLSVAERAANRSMAMANGRRGMNGDWSPLFERLTILPSSLSSQLNSSLLLAIDNRSGLNLNPVPKVASTLIERRRRPISTAECVDEPLLTPMLNNSSNNNNNSSPFYHQPRLASSMTLQRQQQQQQFHHATPVNVVSQNRTSSTTMTLNRQQNQPGSGSHSGVVLYPAYKTLSKSSHNGLLLVAPTTNSKTTSSPKSSSAANKSESLV